MLSKTKQREGKKAKEDFKKWEQMKLGLGHNKQTTNNQTRGDHMNTTN